MTPNARDAFLSTVPEDLLSKVCLAACEVGWNKLFPEDETGSFDFLVTLQEGVRLGDVETMLKAGGLRKKPGASIPEEHIYLSPSPQIDTIRVTEYASYVTFEHLLFMQYLEKSSGDRDVYKKLVGRWKRKLGPEEYKTRKGRIIRKLDKRAASWWRASDVSERMLTGDWIWMNAKSMGSGEAMLKTSAEDLKRRLGLQATH